MVIEDVGDIAALQGGAVVKVESGQSRWGQVAIYMLTIVHKGIIGRQSYTAEFYVIRDA